MTGAFWVRSCGANARSAACATARCELTCPGGSRPRSAEPLRRFRALGLLKTVAGTRKYYLTKRAMNLPVVGRQLTERIILPALAA